MNRGPTPDTIADLFTDERRKDPDPQDMSRITFVSDVVAGERDHENMPWSHVAGERVYENMPWSNEESLRTTAHFRIDQETAVSYYN